MKKSSIRNRNAEERGRRLRVNEEDLYLGIRNYRAWCSSVLEGSRFRE
jgi:hypothetical protein